MLLYHWDFILSTQLLHCTSFYLHFFLKCFSLLTHSRTEGTIFLVLTILHFIFLYSIKISRKKAYIFVCFELARILHQSNPFFIFLINPQWYSIYIFCVLLFTYNFIFCNDPISNFHYNDTELLCIPPTAYVIPSVWVFVCTAPHANSLVSTLFYAFILSS